MLKIENRKVECGDANVGAKGSLLADEIAGHFTLRFADSPPGVDGSCHRDRCHPLPDVALGIAVPTPGPERERQRHADHNSYRRFHQFVLHPPLQPILRK